MKIQQLDDLYQTPYAILIGQKPLLYYNIYISGLRLTFLKKKNFDYEISPVILVVLSCFSSVQ